MRARVLRGVVSLVSILTRNRVAAMSGIVSDYPVTPDDSSTTVNSAGPPDQDTLADNPSPSSTQGASDTPSSDATSPSTQAISPEGCDKNLVDESETSPVLDEKELTRNTEAVVEPPSSTDQSRLLNDGNGDGEDTPRCWRAFERFAPGFLVRTFSSPADSSPYRDRAYWDNLPPDEKRKQYKCGEDYVTLANIPTWEETRKTVKLRTQSPYKPVTALNEKVSLWRGDITRLEIDAIVNAANSSLLGGGGVDGAIHRAASRSLYVECTTLDGCDTGEAKITSGHRLPAKFILHTVGPVNCSKHLLRSCYTNCLELVKQENIESVAFCCIATGVYGYPNDEAANVALKTVREWLETEDNADKVERIIFCVFLSIDTDIYKKLLPFYFPPETEEAEDGAEREYTPPCDLEDEAQGPPSLTRSITEPGTISSVDPKNDQHDNQHAEQQQEYTSMDEGGAEDNNDGVGGAEHDQEGGEVGGAEPGEDSPNEQDQDNEMGVVKQEVDCEVGGAESMDEGGFSPSQTEQESEVLTSKKQNINEQ